MNIPVFVLNFATPQVNPLGFLMPRYDLSNLCYFIERLNLELAALIEKENNVYLIDFDGITSSLGKRYIIDDMSNHVNHGSFIYSSFWSDQEIELTPNGSFESLYRPKVKEAIFATFNECLTAYYTISPTPKVKIVIFDLDGTLWRGVPAEVDEFDRAKISEGWPLSLVEAASFLKKRGILIAIASKNDPETGRKIWNEVYEKRFPIDSFVSVKISWASKVQSIGEILTEVNLLPENCMFVDDNPVEREQVALAFPGIHVIEGPIATWKRSLLWSQELQVPTVSLESSRRTETVKGMIERNMLGAEVPADEYLRNLEVKIVFDSVHSVEDKKFPRFYELLNKTNQFNTTGKRWTVSELEGLFAMGVQADLATVSDRLNDYGLTAIAIRRDEICEQMIMSCRVFGLGVEYALLKHVLLCMKNAKVAKVAFRRTERNGPSAKFLASLGISLESANAGEEINMYDVPPNFLL